MTDNENGICTAATLVYLLSECTDAAKIIVIDETDPLSKERHEVSRKGDKILVKNNGNEEMEYDAEEFLSAYRDKKLTIYTDSCIIS